MANAAPPPSPSPASVDASDDPASESESADAATAASDSASTVQDGGAVAASVVAASAAATTTTATAPLPHHVPNVTGSVVEVPDGFGGSLLIRIQNISSTADLGVRLDLKQIALRCRNTEFNPRRFAAVIMRLREPRATALIFASGRMVVTGTSSSHNASLAAKKFAFIVERVGFRPQPYLDFKIQNLMGTADLGFPVRLEGVAYAHPTFSSYEPELFPGLIYRLVSNPRAVLLIFVSGKVVVTGAKCERDLGEALRKVFPVLVEFRKVDAATLPGEEVIEPEEGEGEAEATTGSVAVAAKKASNISPPAAAASSAGAGPPSVARGGVPRVAKAVASSAALARKGKRTRS